MATARVLGRLESGSEVFELIEVRPGTTTRGCLCIDEALALLPSVRSSDLALLRDALSESGRHPAVADRAHDVIAHVGVLLKSHRLALRWTGRPRVSITFEPVFQNLRDLGGLGPAEEPEPEPTTYIEFRFVDDLGRPIADHAFRLDLPDGSTVEDKTDADGYFIVRKLATPGEGTLNLQPGA